MEIERLFIRKVEALAAKIEDIRPDRYELLEASAIIRHLLLEHLYSSANKNVGRPLRFEVYAPPNHAISEFESKTTAGGLSPRFWGDDGLTGRGKVVLTVDQLLARSEIRIANIDYSVRDVIIVAANKLGGVHHGGVLRANEERLRALLDHGETESIEGAINDMSPIYSQLRDIGFCVVQWAPVARRRVRSSRRRCPLAYLGLVAMVGYLRLLILLTSTAMPKSPRLMVIAAAVAASTEAYVIGQVCWYRCRRRTVRFRRLRVRRRRRPATLRAWSRV